MNAYLEQFRGDRNPTPDTAALLDHYARLKAAGSWPRITEEYLAHSWVVTIHDMLNTANAWPGCTCYARDLQDAIIDAMLIYEEHMNGYRAWVEAR